MLDLNLGILSTHNEDKDCNIQEEDSFNLSNNNFSLITFGILKRKEDVELLPQPPPPPPPDSELSGEREWLNLSSMQRNNQEMLVTTKKNRRGPRSQSSNYRGVTFYRRTGRWESHIWDCGKQVYLGGFETAYTAARAYDRAAIRFRGLQADINFIVDDYKHDIEKMKNLSKEEVVQSLRRECASLPRRGSSKYNHFTLQNQKTHHTKYDHIPLFQNRRWNAAKCNEMRKIEGDIKIGAHNKGNENNLELSLGISSSSDYLMDAVLADRSWVTSNKVPFQSSPWRLSL